MGRYKLAGHAAGTMLVSILVPKNDSFRDLEQSVFEFANRLSAYCASIASCAIVIENPLGHSLRHPAFTVEVKFSVYGNEIRLLGSGAAQRREEALAKALESLFGQVSKQLDPIARDHAGCGCERNAPIWDTKQNDAA
jgi:hypothetical protein